jgi:O-antigen/teichoic acid export membrane protein
MTSENSKRIARNTLMLYSRQMLNLLVSLFTIRIVLNTLGVVDYGIYNVIGGVVTLFSFLNVAMASATQRFFSFALGQGDGEKLKRLFTVNWIIYGSIALLALILLETVGLWFVTHELKIPPERVSAAHWVYQCSLVALVVGVLTTPLTAIITAHEDMHLLAYVSVAEAVMKLATALLLMVIPWNKLELYALLLLGAILIRSATFSIICTRKYEECQYRKFYWDKTLLREIVGFTSWTLFGQLTTVGRTQAITILLNQVFNPVVVAARAIANTITAQINVFAYSFNVGLYPPIIKYYAANNKPQMFSLIIHGSKITFFLLWIFALPLIVEMEMILHLWLKTVPAEAVLFTRLALVEVLITAISMPVITAARAPGRMKIYELPLGSIQILLFLTAWLVLKNGGPAYSVYLVAIGANLLMFVVRLLIVHKLIGLPVMRFIRHSVIPLGGIVILSGLPSFLLHAYLPRNLVCSALSILTSMALASLCMYYMGLNAFWREKAKDMIMARIRKFTRVFSL